MIFIFWLDQEIVKRWRVDFHCTTELRIVHTSRILLLLSAILWKYWIYFLWYWNMQNGSRIRANL